MSLDEHDGRPPDPDPRPSPPLHRVLPDLDAIERWARDAGASASTAPADERYDVETMTVDGMHQVVRSTGGGPGDSADVPPDAVLPPNAAECAAVRSVVRALLDLASHQSGPSHVGVAFTDGSPRIVAWDLAPDPAGGRRPGSAADEMRSPAFPETGNVPGPLRERPPET